MSQKSFNKKDELQYEVPSVKILDIVSEGVLCSSGLGINDWEYDGEDLNF